jgi:hypothetical protein
MSFTALYRAVLGEALPFPGVKDPIKFSCSKIMLYAYVYSEILLFKFLSVIKTSELTTEKTPKERHRKKKNICKVH